MTAILNLTGTPATEEELNQGWNNPIASLGNLFAEFSYFTYDDPDEDGIQERARQFFRLIVSYDLNQTPDGIGALFPEAIALGRMDEAVKTLLTEKLENAGISVL